MVANAQVSKAELGSDSSQKHLAQKWRELSWQERIMWDDQAEDMNKVCEEHHQSTQPADNEWLIRPTPLLASTDRILTEEQYLEVKGEKKWGT